MSDSQDSFNPQSETPLTSEGFGLSTDHSQNLHRGVGDPVDETPKLDAEAKSAAAPKVDLNMLKQQGLELASELMTQAKANPWLTIGLVGVGAAAAGYIFGRSLAPSQEPVVRGLARAQEQTFKGYQD